MCCRQVFETSQDHYLEPSNKISKQNAKWINLLVSIWNALAVRTTTMDEDLPAIFSNLLDLNTYSVMSLLSHLRMRAILGAGEMLPVSLLYNKGPRLAPGEIHHGRWIPTALGRHQLDEVPAMRVDPVTQDLILDAQEIAKHSKSAFFFSENYMLLHEDYSTIQITLGDSLWEIKCHRDPEDRLGFVPPFEWVAFLLKTRHSNGQWKHAVSDLCDEEETWISTPFMTVRVLQSEFQLRINARVARTTKMGRRILV